MISDAQSITFIKEEVRPLAEEIRSLKARIDAAIVEWNTGPNVAITNDVDTIEDGIDSAPLIGSDVHNLVTQLLAIQTQLDEVGVDSVIQKPCVRALRIA